MYNQVPLARTVLSIVGALVMSATFVTAAVGPAQAASAATIVAHPVAF